MVNVHLNLVCKISRLSEFVMHGLSLISYLHAQILLTGTHDHENPVEIEYFPELITFLAYILSNHDNNFYR